MYPCLAETWRRTGEVSKGVSSRIVMARAKLYHIWKWRTDCTEHHQTHATILRAYAPTHRSLQEKEKFYIDLQKTLDGVARDDVLLLLGDFNARVGI